MNDSITVIFTKRKWNPVSWIIRWAMPRTRFHNAISSHCLIVDGDYVVEAAMLHGVRRVLKDEAMKGQHIVRTVDFKVPDAEAGLAWLRTQVGMSYDFRGAFGVALSPDREWAKEGWWFCYELAAATIAAAGRDIFRTYGHIAENALLSVKP
jgi:uncharacterized protein YycO